MRNINILAIQRISAADRAKIEANDPAIQLIDAGGWFDAAHRELKAAQANLVQTEKMASLGQFSAGIAHAIKNPLNFVYNFANLSVELLDELKAAAGPAITRLGDDTL